MIETGRSAEPYAKTQPLPNGPQPAERSVLKESGLTLGEDVQNNAIDTRLTRQINRLLSGPQDPGSPYAEPSATLGDVYAMAASLLRRFHGVDARTQVCLCTDDKATISAALIASLAGGPVMILPYADSVPVLSELHRLTGFSYVVGDRLCDLPEGVQCIIPEKTGVAWPGLEHHSPKGPDDKWALLFTGGSTGTPKMWTKTVRNLMAETLSIIDHYEVSARDRIVATVSPNHIYGLLYAVLTPLLSSAAVAEGTPSFPGEIEQTIRSMNATILVSVPAHYRALHSHPFQVPNLRLAFSSAGMLAQEDATAFSNQTGVPIAEIYGSTETGGIAARVRALGETDFKPYRPIRVMVSDEVLKVDSAYLSPELERDADGYFAMGDRAVFRDNGRFALLGRADGVVKVGGRRVELEAIKEVLLSQPGVQDALVLALPVGTGRENQIVAVVAGQANAAALKQGMTSVLEPYARPKWIKVVPSIPMTAAGKYDRKTIENLFCDQ